MDEGSICIFHLSQPSEKLWGILQRLDVTGVMVNGINLSSFEDWTRQVASEDEPALGLATMFVPMHRVERIFLDAPVGVVESYRAQFERRVGRSVEAVLGLGTLEGR